MNESRSARRPRTFTRAATFPLDQALTWELHNERLHWVLIGRAEAKIRARFPEETRGLPDCQGDVTVSGRRRQSFRVRLQFYKDHAPVYHTVSADPPLPSVG